MKDKIMTYIFIIYIIGFMLISVILSDNDISYSERRKLAKYPNFSINEVLNNDYGKKLDSYLSDQFPFRDTFRSIKASINYNIFNKLENNNIYIKNNYIYKSNYPTNKKSISNFINHVNTTKNFLNDDNNVYLAIIPDKNYYLDTNDMLKMDYNYLYDKLNILDINIIDLRENLSIDDYYETDTHWKQENIQDVADNILAKMHIKTKNIVYEKRSYDKFYGVYYGEAAIKRKPETINYLTNDNINEVAINYLENKSLNKVYNEEKLTSFDAYEVFLDGASAFIEITNDNARTDRELVIFRDSFASSLTPLLIEYYKKITIIDNRYISSKNYLPLIDFTNQDILFLYSTLIINNSSSIKN